MSPPTRWPSQIYIFKSIVAGEREYFGMLLLEKILSATAWKAVSSLWLVLNTLPAHTLQARYLSERGEELPTFALSLCITYYLLNFIDEKYKISLRYQILILDIFIRKKNLDLVIIFVEYIFLLVLLLDWIWRKII